MIILNELKNNKDKIIKSIQKKFKDKEQAKLLVEELLNLYNEKILLSTEKENKLSIVKANNNLILNNAENKEEIILLSSKLKTEIKDLENKIKEVDIKIHEINSNLPNPADELVPEGEDASYNVITTPVTSPKITHSEEKDKPHWELCKEFDIVDFELGNKISGAGFPIYKKQGAKLVRGLKNYLLDRAIDSGYTEYNVPLLVNEDSVFSTGQLPDKEDQMYKAEKDNLYLIPTAEVPLTNLFRDMVIKEKELPIKLVAHSQCFRREAGTYGADVRGLNRLHQFDKVELVRIEHPDKSEEALQDMIKYVTSILEELEIPYRIALLCGGDLSKNASICYDIEIWSKGQKKWLEVSSISNFKTYQANRLKLKYKDAKTDNNHFCHTLNGSALAFPRLLAAILENNQTEDEIILPKVLQGYCNLKSIKK